MKTKLLLYAFVAVLAIGLVHELGIIFYLYWTVRWFDILSHFLGGLSMGFLTFWIFRRLYDFEQTPRFGKLCMIILFFVLVIGVGWEVFEYIYDIADPRSGETYWQDTIYDLIFDSLGAIVASLIIYRKKLHG